MLYNGAAGYQSDSATGLQLLGHRYYDPSIGRFLSSDPAQAGTNWYAYCDNNPIGRLDPSGLYWWFDPNTGNLYWVDPQTGKAYLKGNGYAGAKGHRNDSDDNQHNLGPVPNGIYTIGKPAHKRNPKMGPVHMPMTPWPGNNMFGRSGFWIHGDTPNHNASEGCVVLPPLVRAAINKRRSGNTGSVIVVGGQNPGTYSGLLPAGA